MSELLQLTCNCLTFDFIGTASDESADELGAVQIPTTWRESELVIIDMIDDVLRSLPRPRGSPASLMRCRNGRVHRERTRRRRFSRWHPYLKFV